MTTVITRGAGSAQALGYAARATAANYIEDVFSTYLYTGNSSTQTITNGIDLSTKGGLVWLKSRTYSLDNQLYDTARGTGKLLYSNLTNAQASVGTGLTAFGTNGFTIGSSSGINDSTSTYASWTFRKQAKFFDVVTYTGTGAAQTISHNLGSVPGCMIVRAYSAADNWCVYHRSLGSGSPQSKILLLEDTGAELNAGTGYWNATQPTSTQFTVGTALSGSGKTYVAYLFAHDAGGFGASGSDNVISCGSFTTDGSGVASVNLGFEPQWLLLKNSSISEDWWLFDTMRGLTSSNTERYLIPNSAAAEGNATGVSINSTGFTTVNGTISNSSTYVYIAIRRGPMRTPTSGTSVFSPTSTTSSSNPLTVTTNFPVDLSIQRQSAKVYNTSAVDRLRGSTQSVANIIYTNSTAAEEASSTNFGIGFDNNSAITDKWIAGSSDAKIYWNFRRAPGFFDVVCYTGTGSATTFSHNLGAVPELMIAKQRNGTNGWYIYDATNGATKYLVLNTTAASATLSTIWNNTAPTSSVFSVGTSGATNGSGNTYVAYLFATVAGVSKVGSYTGTGTTLQVNCGFTGGARFVLIKRTDSTGDWYVWDSARGIVAGNDPYLLLNSTAAEVTNTDYVDTYSAGFEISSTAPAAINANGGTFIFLAIA